MSDPMILQALEDSARHLAAEVARLPPEAAYWCMAQGEWSQQETLTHLCVSDRLIFLPRLRAMAERDNPLLPSFDDPGPQQREMEARRPREALVAEFLADRAEEVALLRAHDWRRPGVHAAYGPIDMGWVAHYALHHTWEHLSQMMRIRLFYQLRGGPAAQG